MSLFIAVVDQVAVHGPGDWLVLALAHGGLRTLELDRPVRHR